MGEQAVNKNILNTSNLSIDIQPDFDKALGFVTEKLNFDFTQLPVTWDFEERGLSKGELPAYVAINPDQTLRVPFVLYKDLKNRPELIWIAIAHEMYHCITRFLSQKGYYMVDELDQLLDGRRYYKNWQPYDDDSNFAVMTRKLLPFMKYLQEKPLLKEGMRSLDVLTLQTYLKVLGYFNQTPTSYFGPVTKQSVKDFQKANKLVADGIFGKLSWNTILDLIAKKKVLVEKTGQYQLYPLVERARVAFIEACRLQGEEIKVTEGYRSFERQNELYAQGRTDMSKPKVTNAKGGESFHQYGVCFDVIFTKTGYKGNWAKIGKIGKAMGFTWGGEFKSIVDKPHFELTLGYKLKDFQQGKIDWSKFK